MENYQIQYKLPYDEKWRKWPTTSFPSVNEEMRSRIARLRRSNRDTEFRVIKVTTIETIEVVKE